MDPNQIVGTVWIEFLRSPEIEELAAIKEEFRKPVIDTRCPKKVHSVLRWRPYLFQYVALAPL